MRDEAIGERMLPVEQANHLAFGDDPDPALGHGRRRGETNRLPSQRPFTEELLSPNIPTTASLPVSDNTDSFTLPC
jgi:hypothetical protein